MLSGSSGQAQHHSPGEVPAEKSKVEHWPYFPVTGGWVSAWGPQAAREVSVKSFILHPASSSLKHPTVCSSGVGGCWGVLGPAGLREAVGSGGVTTWVTSHLSASIELGALRRSAGLRSP